MKSLRFGKILGIELELHWSFVLLIGLLAVLLLIFEPANFLAYLGLIFFLFVSVFIHEFFHSLVAVSKGIKVSKIILLPIGGISFTEKMPEKPIDELVMALAGPLFNFFIVFIIILLSLFLPLPLPGEQYFATAEGLSTAILRFPLFALFWVNLILGAFNLFLPALPLDGGRVLRALLAMRLGSAKATEIASRISSILSILLFLFGFLIGNIIVVVIAVFIFLGARAEAQAAIVKESLAGISIEKFINKKPFLIKAEMNLSQAFQELYKKVQTAALIKSKENYFYLDLDLMEKVSKEEWPKTAVLKAARLLPKASLKTPADKIMTVMLEKNIQAIPVFKGKKFLGIIEEAILAKLYQLNRLKKT